MKKFKLFRMQIVHMKIMRIMMFILLIILLAGLIFVSPYNRVEAANLLLADFDSDQDDFYYSDDTFLGTNQPGYASGSRVTGSVCYGGSGGCLNVRLGGTDENDIDDMSGGWAYAISLGSSTPGVSLSLRYRLVMPASYDYDEYSRILVSLDGSLMGRGAKNSIDHTGGDGVFAHDTDWLEATIYLGDLDAGNYTLIIGGFNNRKTTTSEITDIYIDDVALTSHNSVPSVSDAQTLVNRLNINQFKSNIATLSNFGDRCRMSGCDYSSFYNAQDWVEQQLIDMGYTPQKHVYSTGSNLYATKVGTLHPDQMYIVSAHLDGRGGGGAADDDGSGVSLTLEVARILASADVETDISVRFIFWDQEESGMIGSGAYVSDRRNLQGIEDPPGSGLYPEPEWLGVIAHDMVLYDHGVGETPEAEQSVYADLDVEWRDGTNYAAQSKVFAQAWRYYNGDYATDYPANSANYSRSTDDYYFQNYCPSISVRENRRNLTTEWINPFYHQTTDLYANYSEADFLLGFNAVQTTLGAMAELAGAHIQSENNPPTANPQTVLLDEDTSVSVTLTGSDPDGDPLTYTVLTNPANGELSGTAPFLTYTPDANFNGGDSFTFKVFDGWVDSDPGVVTIEVSPVNDQPVATPQSISTTLGTPVDITLTGSDIDGDALNFRVTENPSHGSLSGTPPGLTYTPTEGYAGSDLFQFVANDGTQDSDPVSVLISIEGMVYSLPFEDDFESDRGWVVNPDGTDTATSGWWERENPQGTDFDGPKQLDVTTSETHNLVTGHFAGSNASKFDVDGLTTIRSPLIQLPIGQEITLTFHYYLAHGRNASSADFFRVQVMGDTSLTVLEVHALNEDVDAAWTLFKANLDAFAGQAVQIQIEVGDLSKNSLVEAAVDDFSIIATDPSTPLLLADFDTGTDGFAYIDNPFRDTNQSSYADGAYLPNGGVAGGGLQVVLGGLDTIIIREISGGWGNSFSLPNPSDVIVSFWYKLTQSPDYDLGEYSQVLVSIDGVLYGDGANDYVAQIDGNGNGGIPETTDWQFFSIILENLSAGDHQLVIGGYNNQKSYTNEVTEILIDQIRVRLP